MVILATAALLRIAYLYEYAKLPFLDAPLFDSVIYLHQAEAVRAGNFGDITFRVFSPLYGYLLALWGGAAIGIQLGLGIFNVWLVHRIALRTFGAVGSKPALIAAALYVGYGMFMFHETKIMTETVTLTLALLVLWLFLSDAFAVGRWRVSLGCGALLGLGMMARATLVFSAPFFVLAAFLPWTKGDPLRPRMWRTLGMVAGVGACLLGNGLWNFVNSGHFVPLLMRNEPRAAAWDGTLRMYGNETKPIDIWDFVRRAEQTESRAPGGISLGQFDVPALVRAAPSKLARVFGDVETTFQYGYYGERTEVFTLRALPVSFACLLLLAVVGAVALVRDKGIRALIVHLPFVAGAAATGVFAIPEGRYRLPMVLALIVLSGYGVAAVGRIADRRRRLWATLAVALPCALLAYRTVNYELARPGMWHMRVAEAEAKRGDIAAAEWRMDRAFALDPQNPEVKARAGYVRTLMEKKSAIDPTRP